jgi:bifunctional UDP-N-acetylglucosamine pyrophosphorylase/glucosamine-1-phosphate N-acetyltransferase
VPDPTGLGRIVRTSGGELDRIVEERDASPAQLQITEINAGVYAFGAAPLRNALEKLSTDNEQGEEYLTDVLGLLAAAGQPVGVHVAGDPAEALGCNDRAELAVLRAQLRDRVNTRWMRGGVTILDPATTWIDVTVSLGQDAVVDQNTQLCGASEVGEGATVGPDVTLVDTVVGPGATVLRAHAVGAQIGPRASVGPYAYLRPGTRLAGKSKVGTFVETKNAQIGEGTKVPHLSYVGDATIGEQTNIGAATVFANYDGVTKHHTAIGSHVRTGVDTMFVAPVEVGDGVYTAAGSVIAEDVPPGALGVARARQTNVEGWVERKRPGTAAAEAARRAREAGAGPE